MRKKTCLQLIGLAAVALGLTTQLSGVTVPDQPKKSDLSGTASRPRAAFAPQAGPRALTPNARVRTNGRTNPEEVPDALAFRIYLKAMTLRGTPSARHVLRQMAFLKQLNLSAGDEKVLREALEAASPEVTEIELGRKQLTKTDPLGLSKQTSLKLREDDALDTILTTVTGRLSADGWHKVNVHVREHVKRSIVVYEVIHHAH